MNQTKRQAALVNKNSKNLSNKKLFEEIVRKDLMK